MNTDKKQIGKTNNVLQENMLESYLHQSKELNAALRTTTDLTRRISDNLKNPVKLSIEVEQKSIIPPADNKNAQELSNTMDKIKENFLNMQSMMSSNNFVSTITEQFTNSASEMIGLETILNQIGKEMNYSSEKLDTLRKTSYDTASQYGKTSSDYLSTVLDMAKSGSENPQEMARLSLSTQTSTGINSDSANGYLSAADAAFQYHGNVMQLNALLDEQKKLADMNSISMQDMTTATASAADQLTSAGMKEQEVTALLGTGILSSGKSGEEVANTIKNVVDLLQSASDNAGATPTFIDEAQIKQAVSSCQNLGVQVRYMKDGLTELKSPIQILRELSTAYNNLPSNDSRKSDLLTNLSGTGNEAVLDDLLTNFHQYDMLMSQSGNAAGYSLNGLSDSTNDFESSMNRISNSWNELVQSFVSSELVVGGANLFDGLLQGANSIVETFGAANTAIAAISVIGASKGVG